jgi:hypothetical protein
MNSKQQMDLSDLLVSRNRTGRWLAREIDATESTVSGWRRGLVPSESKRAQIYKALGATDKEIAALGWEKEPVSA